MSTYEVYLGGARQQNSDYAMLPAAPFQNTQVFVPGVRQQPTQFMLARNLDFGGETALKAYVAALAAAGTPLASGDKLGSVVIPANFVAEEFYWAVVTPVTGGQFSAATRNGGVTLKSATTTASVDNGIVAWPTAPELFQEPDILDVTFDTVPAGGLEDLVLQVIINGHWYRAGNY